MKRIILARYQRLFRFRKEPIIASFGSLFLSIAFYSFFLTWIFVGNVHAQISSSWSNTTFGGNWTDAVNWSSNVVPNGIGDTADFGNAPNGSVTLNVNGNITLGTLQLGARANSLLLDGTSSLTWQVSNGHAFIDGSQLGDLSIYDQTIELRNQQISSGSDQTFGSLSGNLIIDATGANISVGAANTDTTLNAAINAANSTKEGTGTLTVGSLAGQVAAFNNIGQVNINEGVLATSSPYLFGQIAAVPTPVVLGANGTLDLNGNSQRIGSLAGDAGSLLRFRGINGFTTSLEVGGANQFTTFSGNITGDGQLIQNGSGGLILRGSNDYTGGTYIFTGTIIGNTQSIPESNGVLLDGPNSSVVFVQDANVGDGSYGGTITGQGSFFKDGGTSLTLTGANDYSGGTVLLGGTLVGSTNNIPSSGGLSINNGTVRFDQSTGDGDFSGNIIGNTGTLAKAGGQVLTLSGSNNYSSATVVEAGTLRAGSSNAFSPNSAFTLATNAVLDLNDINQTISSLAGSTGSQALLGTGNLTAGDNNASTIFSGTMDGSGSFIKTGTATTVLNAVNTYTGGTEVQLGALRTTIDGAMPISGNVDVASGATLDLNGYSQSIGQLTGVGSVTLGSRNAQLTIDSLGGIVGFEGVISGTGKFNKIGAGATGLAGQNTYVGQTNVVAGILRTHIDSALPVGGSVDVSSGATLDVNGTSQHIGALTGSGAIALGSGGTLFLDSSVNATFSGNIGGAGGIVVQSTGAVTTLSGTNNFSGFTTVNTGTLRLDTGRAISAFLPTYVNGGANLDLNGMFVQIGPLTGSGVIQTNGGALFLSPLGQSSQFDGSIQGTGGLTLNGQGTVILTGNNTYSGVTGINTATLQLRSDLPNSTVGVAANSSLNIPLVLGHTATAIGSLVGFVNSDVQINNNYLRVGGNNQTGDLSGTIQGDGGLLKDGTGTLTLNGPLTYTGRTEVLAGRFVIGSNTSLPGGLKNNVGATLEVAAGDTLNGNIVNEGTLQVRGHVNGQVVANAGSTVKGSGNVNHLIALRGSHISPGNSPGTLTAGTALWDPGSFFDFEINDALGTAGADPGWDKFAVTGALDISATAFDQFKIDVKSLGLDNLPGTASHFDQSQSYHWAFASFGSINGFDPAAFLINLSGFRNSYNGSFSVSQVGNELDLNYQPFAAVPEPASMATSVILGSFYLLTRRSRKKRFPSSRRRKRRCRDSLTPSARRETIKPLNFESWTPTKEIILHQCADESRSFG